MENNNIFRQVIKTAALLVAVLAIVFSTPMVSHANMVTGAMPDHHEQQIDTDTRHITAEYDLQVFGAECDLANAGAGEAHKSGADCCSNMCVAAVLLTFGVENDVDEFHAHLALPHSVLNSAERARLMRPPSL